LEALFFGVVLNSCRDAAIGGAQGGHCKGPALGGACMMMADQASRWPAGMRGMYFPMIQSREKERISNFSSV
jgi:hypothetical protein